MKLESPLLSRAILEHIIADADMVGEDIAGRPVLRFEFACDPWFVDKLTAFGVVREDLEVEPEEAA